MDFQTINQVVWVIGNVLVAYIAIALPIFVLAYIVLFNPRATLGGKLIFRFFVSLVGVIALVFIGTFVDPFPDRTWFLLSPEIEPWRPLLRLAVYGFVSYTITSLAILLGVRKWGKSTDPRNDDLVKLRNTTEIPIVNP